MTPIHSTRPHAPVLACDGHHGTGDPCGIDGWAFVVVDGERYAPDADPRFDPPRGPVCDGPKCWDMDPATQFDRGFITTDELPTAQPERIHRAPCAIVRDLLR